MDYCLSIKINKQGKSLCESWACGPRQPPIRPKPQAAKQLWGGGKLSYGWDMRALSLPLLFTITQREWHNVACAGTKECAVLPVGSRIEEKEQEATLYVYLKKYVELQSQLNLYITDKNETVMKSTNKVALTVFLSLFTLSLHVHGYSYKLICPYSGNGI